MKRRALAGLLGAMWVGCSAPGDAPRSVDGPRVDACVTVAAARDALIAEGRIQRAAEALGRASASCPRLPPSLLSSRGALLAELGDASGAEAIAAQLAGSPDAASRDALGALRVAIARFAPQVPEGAAREAALDEIDRAAEAHHAKDHARALAGYMRAWEAWHPLAQASIGAGLASFALGRRPEARRLFDRGLAEGRRPFEGSFVTTPRDALPQAVSPNGSLLAVVAWGGVLVFARASRRIVTSLARASSGPATVGVSFDTRGARVASLVGDTLMINHALSGRLLGSHRLEPDHDVRPARAVTAFSPDGLRVAFISRGVGVVDLDTGALRYLDLGAQVEGAAALAWSSDGGRLAVGYGGGIDTWDTRTLGRSRRDRAEGTVVSLRFGEGDHALDAAAVATKEFFTRRDTATGAVTRRLAGSTDIDDFAAGVALSADGSRVARVSRGKGLEVWDIESGERRLISRSPAWDGVRASSPPLDARLLFPGPGDEVLGRCRGRGVCAYDARPGADPSATPKVIVGAPDAGRWAVARSPNGNAIVEVNADDRVRVWDLSDGTLRVLPFITGCERERAPVVLRGDPDAAVSFGRVGDPRRKVDPLVEIVDMRPDGASFRVLACGHDQSFEVPELAGRRGTSDIDVGDVTGIEGLRAGLVRRHDTFDIVGPDADADATRALLLCNPAGFAPLEVCEGERRVPGLLRGDHGAP